MVCPNKVGRYPKAKINSVAKKFQKFQIFHVTDTINTSVFFSHTHHIYVYPSTEPGYHVTKDILHFSSLQNNLASPTRSIFPSRSTNWFHKLNQLTPRPRGVIKMLPIYQQNYSSTFCCFFSISCHSGPMGFLH